MRRKPLAPSRKPMRTRKSALSLVSTLMQFRSLLPRRTAALPRAPVPLHWRTRVTCSANLRPPKPEGQMENHTRMPRCGSRQWSASSLARKAWVWARKPSVRRTASNGARAEVTRSRVQRSNQLNCWKRFPRSLFTAHRSPFLVGTFPVGWCSPGCRLGCTNTTAIANA